MDLIKVKFPVLFVFFGALAGCITTRTSLQAEAEKQQERQHKAELEMRVQETQEDFRSLIGRIEVLERNHQDAETQKLNDVQQRGEEAKKLNEKIDLLVESMGKMEARLEKMAVDSEAHQNDYADFKKQFEDFKKAQQTKPLLKSPAAAPAKTDTYSQAASDFGKGRWREAALGFQQYRERNPKGARYAEATYNMGLCFEKLQMMDEARVFFEEVVTRFPKSKYAQTAQARLKNIKKN